VTGIVGCGSCLLTGDPRRLPGFPQALALLPDGLERPTMLVVDLPRFLRQSPELFRVVPGRLGRTALLLGEPTVLLGFLAAVLSLFASAFRLLAERLCRDVVVRHVDAFLSIARAGVQFMISIDFTTRRNVF
jgi:hypothetical protein